MKELKEEKHPVRKSIIENSAWNFAASMVTRIGALIFTIILARFLLPEGYGIYGLALSTAFLFAAFSGLGIDGVLVRYLADALGKKNKKLAAGYFRYIFKIKIVLIVLVSAALLLMAYPISMYLYRKPELLVPLLLFVVYIIVSPFEGFFSSFFLALKKMQYSAIKETLTQALRIALVLAVLLALKPIYHINGVIIALMISSFVGFMFAFYIAKKLVPFVFGEKSEIDKERVLKFMKASVIYGLSGIIFSYVDSIMLGIVIPQAEFIGYYRAAYTLVFSASGLITISSVLVPFFTQFRKENLGEAMQKVLRYATMLSIPAAFGMIALGRYFIVLIYGYEYLPAVIPLYIMAFLLVSESVGGVLGSVFSAREKPEETVKGFLIASGINVVLNVVLILYLLKFGAIWAVAGASASTLVSRYFYMIYLGIASGKILKFKFRYGFLIRQIVSSAVMLGVLMIALRFVTDMSLVYGALLVALGIVIYFGVNFAIGGLNKEDISLVSEFVMSKIKRN